MIRLTWSPQALRDVEAIREYIATDSTRYADLVVRRIVASVELYRVVYRRGAGEVEIATVFHASRLFPDIV